MIAGSLKENTEESKVVYENIHDHIYENISNEQTLTIAGTTTCTPKPGNIIGERSEQLATRDKLKDQVSKTKEKLGGTSPKMTPKMGLIRSVLEKNITRKLSDSRTYVKKTNFDELVTGASSKRARVRSISRDDSGVLGRPIFQTNTETRETHSDGEDVPQKTRKGIGSFLGVKLSASRDKTVLDGFARDSGSKGTQIRSISRDNGVGFSASRDKTILDGFATDSGSKRTRIRSISRDNGVGFSASRDKSVLDGFATDCGSKGTRIRSISRDNGVGFYASRDKTVLDGFARDSGSKGTRIQSISRDNGVGFYASRDKTVLDRFATDIVSKGTQIRSISKDNGVGFYASRDKTVLDRFATDIVSKGTQIRSISKDNGVGFYASRDKTVLDRFATDIVSKGTQIRSISKDNGVGFYASRDKTVLDRFATDIVSKGTQIRSISKDNGVGFYASRDKTGLDGFARDSGSKGTRIRSISRDNGVGFVRSVCERDTARKLSDSRAFAPKTGTGIRSLFGMISGRKKSVRELVQTFSRETEKENSSIKHGLGISSGNAVNKLNIVTTSPEAKPRRDQGKTLFNGNRKISGDGKYSDALPLSAHCSPLLIARSRKHPIDTWSENVENSIGCSTVCRVHKECWNRKISEAYVRKDLVDPRLMRTLSENKLLYR